MIPGPVNLTSSHNQWVKALKAAQGTRKAREREGCFVLEGLRAVSETLHPETCPRALFVDARKTQDEPVQAAVQQALAIGAQVFSLTGELFDEVSSTETPQGIIALVPIPTEISSSERLSSVKDGLIVVLDAVQDPGNAGTIIRTADAAGAKAVIALPGTVDIWSPKVIRGTMGSILHLPVFGWPEGRMNLMGELSRISCPCVLADPHSQTPFWDLRLPGGPRALILGNEGNGPGPEWRGANVIDVAIPIYGKAESLNVAVSAGILIYALIR